MADNTRGIGGLYSSGYGPYQTPTNARFIRRPATNFMTGQTVQNPAIDIFDVTMNPDQFFGGSGTGTFNQTFQGSVARPGLGSGNPNLGDPTFGGGSGSDGGAGGGNNGGGNNTGGNNGGGNNGGGDNGGGVIVGPGPGGGGDVDLELPDNTPSSSDQLKNIILSGVVGLGITEGYNALTGKETILDRIKDRKIRNDNQDIIDANQIDLQNQFNDTLTDAIDSGGNRFEEGLIEDNIETKFEEDLYDNLDPDEGLVTDANGDVIGASDFTDLDNLIGGGNVFTDGTNRVTVDEDVAGSDKVEKLQKLRDAGFNATDALDIIDSLALGSISLQEYEALVGGGTGKVTVIENPTSEELMTRTSSDDIFTTDDNLVLDETSGQYGTINSAGNFVPTVLAGASGLANAASTGTDLLSGSTRLISDSGISSTFAGSSGVPLGNQPGATIIDFGSAMDNAEYVLSGFQTSSIGLLGPDKHAYSYDLGRHVTEAEFIEMGGQQAQNIIASDLPAEELVTDGSGNIFNKLGEFMGNKDALGIGVSPGQVVSGISGVMNLADFIDDPSFSSGLGTLAGAGGLFFPGAAANPYLAGAAVVAGLLEGQQEPSNETGIANLDLGSGEVISYGMGGDKQNDQNVETADTIATAMTPIANDIAETYGVTFEGDIEVGLGNRDDMYVSIGNQEEDSTYMDRLTYNPDEGDLNLMSGVEGQVLTYRYEPQSGEKIVEDLTKNLTLAAQKAVANGETVVNLSNAVGAAPSGEALEQKFSNLGIEDYAIEALTGSAKGYGGSNGILPQLAVSYDDRQYLTADEEMALIEMGLLNPEDAAFVQENTQYVDSSDPDFVGPLPV